MEEESVKVSVHMITYNHEKYISQAIEGVLMQKTDFPIELIISDDCSTDRTRDIVTQYAKINLAIVKPLYRKSNLGSMKNFLDTFSYCSGKYIAICEGDDYWSDPYKLQKQVDFLESNPDYGMVHTDYNVLIDDGENVTEIPSYHTKTNEIMPSGNVKNELIKHNFIATLTVVAKKCFIDEYNRILPIKNILNYKQGDYPIWLFIAGLSKIGYLKSSTSLYRVVEGSLSHSSHKKKKIAFLLSEYRIKIVFLLKYRITDLALYWQLVKEFPLRLWTQIN